MTTLAGTMPYIAPEVFFASSGSSKETSRGRTGGTAASAPNSYSYPADWWSLGVTAFELKAGRRPFDFNSKTSCLEIMATFSKPQDQVLICPSKWSQPFSHFITCLLQIKPEKRTSSLKALKDTKLMSKLDLAAVVSKKETPPFVPQVSFRASIHTRVHTNTFQHTHIYIYLYLHICQMMQ